MKSKMDIEIKLEMLPHFDIDNTRVLFCPVWAPAIRRKVFTVIELWVLEIKK